MLHLEQLPHQEAAIENIMMAMKDCLDTTTSNPDANYIYANPIIKRMRGIDVKMETGTGKTYVYTRLMHELYHAYGINKFIIMTPSLPIKEGVKSFISSDYATQHFNEIERFRAQKISLGVINAGDFITKKGKRRQFAGALSEFCDASRNDVGTINALLLNDAMLGSKSMDRDDYDQTLIGGSTRPIEALSLTRPIVIIDEPHRFRKDGTAWANIAELNPQLIIRFGATFPERTIGRGRARVIKKDYDNLVYDLTAVDSFNQGLVKAINVQFPNLPADQAAVQYKVTSATNKELTLSRDSRSWTLRVGDDLSNIDVGFEGDVTYDGKQLSNGLELSPGMVLIPGLWTNSYQEMILRQAIESHFAKERELFHRPMNAPRIKTISLFFIDSVSSYRNPDGWLKTTFERLLNEKLDALIAHEKNEYRDFLVATKTNLNSDSQSVHGGYFADDTGKKGDEEIQAQVNDILRNKEQMLQFRDEKGDWNLRRFLFSKWTLREGWDNPNVFVLTKLRSSGSESSKIQEVGRGLRLPVDELGNRISNEEFRLDFLVDYSERDFAERLVGEINSDGGQVTVLTNEVLEAIAESSYNGDIQRAFIDLLQQGIIDMDKNVHDQEAFLELLPAGIIRALKKGKVTTNQFEKPKIHLRKDNWLKIEQLWNETSRRFMLQYENINEHELCELISGAFRPELFQRSRGTMIQYRTDVNGETGDIVLTQSTISVDQNFGEMKYRNFIKRLHEATSVPINVLHTALRDALVDSGDQQILFNEQSLSNCIEAYKVRFIEKYQQKYEYDALDFRANISITNDEGGIVDYLDQGAVGSMIANDVRVPNNYLYDEMAFDSDLEHEILKLQSGREVIVFGKLPRRSIRVPTFIGGTSSPDFVYAIRDTDTENVKLYALIEAKGKSDSALTYDERAALDAQSRLSQKLNNVEISLVKDVSKVRDIIERLSGH